MFAGSPSNVATVNPAHSASAASSVKSPRPSRAARRWASRIASNRNACGVCAMRSRARSGVASTFPLSPISLMVSATGIAGTAAPVRPRHRSRAKSAPPRRTAARRRGSERCRAFGRRALQARRAPKPGASPRHWQAAAWRKPGGGVIEHRRVIGIQNRLHGERSRGWRQNGSMARKITVCPPIDRYCFGPPAAGAQPASGCDEDGGGPISFRHWQL